MPHPRAQRRTAFLAAIAVAVVVPVWWVGSDRGEPADAAAAVPVVTDSSRLVLPIDRYFLTPDRNDDLARARMRVLSACMRARGVSFRPPPVGPDLGPRTRTERRYGVTDLALAGASGYHLGDRDPRTAPRRPAPLLAPAERAALHGPAADTPRSAGHATGGGCAGEVDRRLGDPDVGIRTWIDAQSLETARTVPPVAAAMKEWSACMRSAGYDYADPWAPTADHRFSGPRPTAAERAVATADVACKQRTNVVGYWYVADVAIQRALIERHHAELAVVLAGQQAQLAAVQAVLGR